MDIYILVTNTDRSDFAAKHPRDGEKFTSLLAPLRPDWRFTAFDVTLGAFPDDLDQADGIIITGSPASVHDTSPWIAQLDSTIRIARKNGIPLFGACFGHQAIARALGGTVEENPGGWVLGRAVIEITDPAPWMDNAPKHLSLYAAHLEQVTCLPPGAHVTDGSTPTPVGGFVIEDQVWTTQYHPEMTHGFITALTEELEGKLPEKVTETARQTLKEPADRDTIARWIVQFFEQSAVAG